MANGEKATREYNGIDQEKLQSSPAVIERRQHNDMPFQKMAMPRWNAKGKEKSSLQLACTWVVDHQISMHTPIWLLK